MIQPGQKLELNFSVKVMLDGQPQEVTFASLLRRRTVVSVYMKNNTPGCDRQNAALIAVAAELDHAGFDLLALSRDTCGSHRRYAEAKGIPYRLVSDPEDRFAWAADAMVQKSMYGRTFVGPARSAYVLEADGTVRAVVTKVEPTEHAAQLRHAITLL